jgi:hypothetical protein
MPKTAKKNSVKMVGYIFLRRTGTSNDILSFHRASVGLSSSFDPQSFTLKTMLKPEINFVMVF